MNKNKIIISVVLVVLAIIAIICFQTPRNSSQQNPEEQPSTIKTPEQYSIKSDGVYSYGQLIVGADPKTFQEIGGNYSKDSKNIYYQTKVVEGINQNTSALVPTETNSLAHYLKDKGSVYLNGVKLENVDSETFVYIGQDYSKDKNSIYYGNIGPASDPFATVKGADTKTFEVIGGGYAKDKNYVYLGGKQTSAKPENCTVQNPQSCVSMAQ